MPGKRQSGFTLLEMMITVAVGAILAAIAYPNLHAFMQRNSVIAQSNSLQANLQYARGQAAATRGYVSICPLAPASSATAPQNTTCDTADGNYQYGWIIYSATSANSAFSATTSTLQAVVPAPSNMSVNSDTAGILTYNSLGELLANNGGTVGPANVNFWTCADAHAGDALGVSTTTVPGVQLVAADSGRIASAQMVAGAVCN
jgi:type IV fimbrial biogenesis protein FimT